ncbi:MAG: hypothetical protein HOV80_10235, partial [Polyangiaceae bacterium]|nr:hypothetical protein [Polyangiaceae bacterium]
MSRKVSAVVVALLLAACDAPSSSVDPNDLKGVFENDGGPKASASAVASGAKPKPRASASAARPPAERAPDA